MLEKSWFCPNTQQFTLIKKCHSELNSATTDVISSINTNLDKGLVRISFNTKSKELNIQTTKICNFLKHLDIIFEKYSAYSMFIDSNDAGIIVSTNLDNFIKFESKKLLKIYKYT